MHTKARGIACIALMTIAVFQQASGQSAGGSFSIDRVTITGGGTLSGGTFGLSGTFGQATTGTSSGGTFALDAGARIASDSIFSNGFEIH